MTPRQRVLVLLLGLGLLIVLLVVSSRVALHRTSPKASAPEPIEAPALRPIGNAKNWMLTEPMVYRVGTSSDSIIVPAGFVTDFASIPPRLQSLISPLGPHVLPAVVHDYLYWEQGCTRGEADVLFWKAMTEMGVPQRERQMMYEAVHRFGQVAWAGNARDRADGKPRIVPSQGVRRNGRLETWEAYRAHLYSAGVRPGPRVPISRGFCAHGRAAR